MLKKALWFLLIVSILAGCQQVLLSDSETSHEETFEDVTNESTLTADTQVIPSSPYPGIVDDDGVNKTVIYAQPDSLAENVTGTQHQVWINGNPSCVYCSKATISIENDVNYPEYVYFSFAGTANIAVEPKYEVNSVEILPSGEEIDFSVEGNTITFSIDQPGQYFVKINGNESNGSTAPIPLYLYANPLENEDEVPKKGIPGEILYFSPGVYEHRVYEIRSGMTVYLAGGAFVYGQFYSDGAEDIKIIGRGTICAEYANEGSLGGRAIRMHNTKNVTIEGIQVVDPLHWTIELYNCENVTVRNVKTISSGQGSDAIDVRRCQNVLVEDCFFRASDDVLAVKYSANRVTFRNCVVWADDSNPMTIGYDVVDAIQNVLFEDIHVLNYSAPDTTWLEPVIAIEPHQDGDGDGKVDAGSVDGVVFRNIRVDVKLASQNSLFQFHIYGGKGTIRNITLDNVWVNYGGYLNGRLYGTAKVEPIDNIQFINVRNSEGYVLTHEDILKNEYVGENITIFNDDSHAVGVPVNQNRYEYKWDFSNINGYRNWYYLYLENGKSEYKNMYLGVDTTSWLTPDGACFNQYIGIFVGRSVSPVIAWEAPEDGVISLDSLIKLRYPDGGSVILDIKQNENSLYSGKLLPGDAYRETLTLTVKKGDRIYFIYNCDFDNYMDCVRMNAVIEYTA